jgi:hypothetical protein
MPQCAENCILQDEKQMPIKNAVVQKHELRMQEILCYDRCLGLHFLARRPTTLFIF